VRRFGSLDYYSCVAGNLKQFMDGHYIADVRKGMQGLKDKPYVLFYSHGGGGRAIDGMKRIFRRVGTLVGEPVESRRCPSPEVLEECVALGKMLAENAAQA
jgi:flavorubredoxin